MPDLDAALATRLLTVAAAAAGLIAWLALRWRIGARGLGALLLCSALGAAALAAVQPLLGLGQYGDYKYYLQAVGVLVGTMPARPLFAWIAQGGAPFTALLWLNGVLAVALVAMSWLAARAAGAGLGLASAAALLLVASAPFLVYAVDANPVTPFAWAVTATALLLEEFLRAPHGAAGWGALGLSALIAGAAFAGREEAIFLAALAPLSLLASDRLAAAARWPAVLAWLALCGAVHAGLAIADPAHHAYLAARVAQYAGRLGNQVPLFLATSAMALLLPLIVWNLRGRPLRPALTAPLLLFGVAFALIYASGASAGEHQIVVLPLLLPQALLGLRALATARPRLARAVAGMAVLWIVASSAYLLDACRRGEKQREYEVLTAGVAPGSAVHFVAYPAFDVDPDAPLLALLTDSVRLQRLTPPAGCPPNLFDALAWMQARCAVHQQLLPRCREAVAAAGPDWVDQAQALAELLELTPAMVAGGGAGGGSKWGRPLAAEMRGTQPTEPETSVRQPAGEFLFVPFWVRRDRFNDLPTISFPEFRWWEATRLGLEVPVPDVAAAGQSLISVTVRPADAAAAQCAALRQRASAAKLFERLEASTAP